ncbi:tyrosinase family protein [Chromobacterium sp. CV08]|uniref:tyrosinase family protein n=1 Tax=Chromobacterium sp. CV08 TaxID=3133274 RepID=UPI003DA8088A
MSKLNRRQLLQGGAVVFGSLALSEPVWARLIRLSRGTRYNVASPQGKAMLQIYAGAVKKMMDPALYPEGNPLNWIFQWYTHFVRADRTKLQELNRVYPSPSANRTLAEKMWDTCQAHSSGQREDFFLPWHRMFITYFEDIIRQVSGRHDFTLPYWDYTDPAQQVLPVEFRQPGDPVWGPLYRATRWPDTNAGKNVTLGPGGMLTLDCMKSNLYSGSAGDAGFCANTDMNPHGALHVDVGNGEGMASVPWAANDPIFWIHHCNIDRIWASWNLAGGKNPSDAPFLNQQFVFASPTGTAVVGTVKNFLSLPKDAYSSYVKRPPGSLPFPIKLVPLKVPLAMRLESFATEAANLVRLGNAPVTVSLGDAKSTSASAPRVEMLSSSLGALGKQSQLFLRFEGLSAHGAVSGVYNVYVHAGDMADPAADARGPGFVGQINFFSAAGTHQHDGEAAGNAPDKKAFSFLLTAETRAWLQKGGGEPRVTLVPTASSGNDEAMPSIDKIALVAS